MCIIGAGVSGLCMLRELVEENSKTTGDAFDVTVFDRNPDVGGLWQYAERSHEIGGPGVLYKNLR